MIILLLVTLIAFAPALNAQSKTEQRCCRVIELRQYEMQPGKRDTLIHLFEREFIESQEALDMRIAATFRDLDRPDVFTWIRGFPAMGSRGTSLEAFYFGPVWKAHREAANATMISADNVRLLKPVPESEFMMGALPSRRAATTSREFIVATIYRLNVDAAKTFPEFFETSMVPLLAASGATPIGVFETEPEPNNFPRLRVREGEHAFVWFARFDNPGAYERHLRVLAAHGRWTGNVHPALQRALAARPEIWRLAPTARSRALSGARVFSPNKPARP